MPTSVHLPPTLLAALDRKARALRISRNRLVVRALEREIDGSAEWSPSFFERLAESDPLVTEAVDEMLAHVSGARRSKAAPRL